MKADRTMVGGPEFAGRVLQDWAARNGVELRFLQPGKPVQNAYIESFNSRFRDECLSQHWFASLSHMRSVIEVWREDDNEHRPHSALGDLPPAKFAALLRAAMRQTERTERSDTINTQDSRSKLGAAQFLQNVLTPLYFGFICSFRNV